MTSVTVHFSRAYNILVFAFGVSNSHVLFDARLADILAGENGQNNVTLLIEEYNPDTKKAKISKFVEEIRYSMIDPKKWQSMMSSGNEVYEDKVSPNELPITIMMKGLEKVENACFYLKNKFPNPTATSNYKNIKNSRMMSTEKHPKLFCYSELLCYPKLLCYSKLLCYPK
uniref:Uncharacterized protein n=1 Tax=Romanomermis culicivorax TaxID=13658 RepID=A0A915K205_ROMCU